MTTTNRSGELILSEPVVPLGPPFGLTATTLVVHNGDALTIEQAGEAAGRLKMVRGSLAYWMGDLIDIIEQRFGEQASQIIDPDFLDEKTVADYRFVAKNVAPPQRLLAPSWDHARAVASLKPAAQDKWLQRALDEDWIASKLKSEIAADGAGGDSAMRFLVIVDAKTEAKQQALAKQLEADGYACTLRTGVKKEKKAKAKKGKGKRKGAPRPYARRKGKKS